MDNSFASTAGRRTLNAMVPVNMRQFIAHLVGDNTPLTEMYLTPGDLAVLRDAIARTAKPGQTQGVIGYGDYGPDIAIPPESGVGQILKDSFTNPAYRMETTLGMANWAKQPDGSYTVTDKYRFDANRALVDQAMRDRGLMGMLAYAYRQNGPLGVLNALGNIYGRTEDEAGTPVNIRVGKR